MSEENNNNKEVTVDQLAVMVNDGFGRMDKGFAEAKEEREEIVNRLDKVDNRLDTIEKNQGRDDRRVTNLEDSMRVVKTTVGIED